MQKVRTLLALTLVAVLLLAACASNGGTMPNNAGQGVEPGDDLGQPTMVATDAVPQTGDQQATCDSQQLASAGQAIYTESCAGCHGEQGEGVNGPPLAGNERLSGDDSVMFLQSYMAVDTHPKDLAPEDLAAVLTYSRTSFGNTGMAVCPDEVQPVQ